MCIGRSKGDIRDTPPSGPNSFNFMQFLVEKWLNNSFSHLPLELPPPPRGNPGSATDVTTVWTNQNTGNFNHNILWKIMFTIKTFWANSSSETPNGSTDSVSQDVGNKCVKPLRKVFHSKQGRGNHYEMSFVAATQGCHLSQVGTLQANHTLGIPFDPLEPSLWPLGHSLRLVISSG